MNSNIWKKSLEYIFTLIGLSEKEARVYRVLLEMGEGKVAKIASGSQQKRGITYAVLDNLEKQGLIRKHAKEGKTYFQAEDPQKLVDIVNDKKKQIGTIESSLNEIAPRLRSQYKLSVGKPTIRYFEGEEGLKAVFSDIYAKKKDIVFGCVDLERADEVFPSHITKKLIPLRIRNRVEAYSFIADSPQARIIARNDKKQLRKSVLLNKEKYPLPSEIDVYEDKIAMLSFVKGDFIGLIIENQDLAQSLRSIFKLAFTGRGKSTPDKDTRTKAG
jgi:sugar-specific transcriptional regulator TrmB